MQGMRGSDVMRGLDISVVVIHDLIRRVDHVGCDAQDAVHAGGAPTRRILREGSLQESRRRDALGCWNPDAESATGWVRGCAPAILARRFASAVRGRCIARAAHEAAVHYTDCGLLLHCHCCTTLTAAYCAARAIHRHVCSSQCTVVGLYTDDAVTTKVPGWWLPRPWAGGCLESERR